MSRITNLIPNPLLTFPNSAISTYEATVQHVDPDRMIITPNNGAVNPYAKIRLCEPVSGDFHLNFWLFNMPEDSRWHDGICYIDNANQTVGRLFPHNNTAGATFLGFDFHLDDMQFIQLKCPLNHPLQFSAINLMTQADWNEYKKISQGALYGDLMPLQN
ncbi:hypothetical protein CJ196_08330 [Bifidobacterium breve]|uniref:hypothetical protein n=1 Tax=Bifidobacterium breve TaxID=1685 RepID=UPI000C76E2DD|nr:hypothetical protein [Bifidobacterium breve]PKY88013.1 hypothetical protein CYJ38_08640 [Bifidobacterium breve]PMC72751.1 hypothetical protein CJ196_08330 [Bifidobacterium breve]